MEDIKAQPQPPPPAAPVGALVWLGLPIALQIAAMYVLIAVETPLTPWVQRLLERREGVVVLSGVGFMAVCVVMMAVFYVVERRSKKPGA